jgi:hypothetical protein
VSYTIKEAQELLSKLVKEGLSEDTKIKLDGCGCGCTKSFDKAVVTEKWSEEACAYKSVLLLTEH